ncbi:DUF2752 domain-containing protein [Streptomycetaceae bacterium NBC_01309]
MTAAPPPDAAPGWGTYPAPPPPPRGLVRRMAGPVAVAAGAAAAAVYLSVVDPNEPGHYPVCPFLKFTGAYCPGCGGLRCANALARLDVPAALAYNAFAVAMVPLLAFIWLRWTARSVRGRVRMSAADPRLVRLLVAAIVLFTVVRNLPFGTALAP